MLTAFRWVGEGSAVDHLRGTRAEPRELPPLLMPQAMCDANFALNVTC